MFEGTINIFKDTTKSNSWILGPSIGTNAKWMLSKIFSVKANFDFAIFYQDFEAKHIEQNNHTTTSLDINIRNDFSALNPFLALGFILEAGSYIINDNLYIAVDLGYENQIFFNQNYMRHLKDISKSYQSTNIGDLFLHGLNIGLSFNF